MFTRLQERNTYQDDNHSVENIVFAEASNMQVHNSIDYTVGPQ